MYGHLKDKTMVQQLITQIENNINNFLLKEESSQLNSMFNSNEGVIRNHYGYVLFDVPKIDYHWQVYTDGIIRDLDLMVAREIITEDEANEIKLATNLD